MILQLPIIIITLDHLQLPINIIFPLFVVYGIMGVGVVFCMYLCMYVCMHVCINVHVCISMYMYVVCMHVCVTLVCMYACIIQKYMMHVCTQCI